MKRRKRICVIVAEIDDLYQQKAVPGIIEQCFKYDYDCYIFSYYLKVNDNPKIEAGNINICNLINFETIDAVIIMPDTIANKDSLTKIIDLVKENFKGPVISMDITLPEFKSIVSDDGSIIEALCDHLIEKHNHTIIDFMSGIKGHEHSVKRQNGYIRSLKKHGIEFDERRIHYGDFWYTSGDAVAEEILSSDLPLPQAVVTAGDPMAMGLMKALNQRGIDIPGQIAVTGYDSMREGIEYTPSVTSADLPGTNTGKNAVEYIHSIFEGKEYVPIPPKPNIKIAQSCGCGIDIASQTYMNEFTYSDEFFKSHFQARTNNMMSELISANTVDELRHIICMYVYQVKGFENIYICLNDDWLGNDHTPDASYRTSGYPEKINTLIFLDKNFWACEGHGTFNKKDLLPDYDVTYEKPSVFYFFPLNFYDRAFGYTALRYETPSLPNIDYSGWSKFVSNSFECLRVRLNLEMMYKKVERAALRDGLTKLYNRNAFNMHIEKLIEDSSVSPQNALFVMADLNFLKKINDKFGHIAGDTALSAIAQAIEQACTKKERCYRFGGDEYMIIGISDYTTEEIDNIAKKINDYLEEYNQNSGLPFKVLVSLGYIYTEINENTKIDDIIQQADEKMYINKQKSKLVTQDPYK